MPSHSDPVIARLLDGALARLHEAYMTGRQPAIAAALEAVQEIQREFPDWEAVKADDYRHDEEYGP